MADLIERLRSFVVERGKIACGSDIVSACNSSALSLSDLRALLAALEAAREDAERLAWLATDGCVEGFVDVEQDIYDYACDVAEESGRDEPNDADMLGGFRRLVDAAIDQARGKGGGEVEGG